MSAVRPWDLALGRGMLRGGSAEIGIAGGCQCPFPEHCSSGLVLGLPPGTLFVWRPAGWTAGGDASLGAAGHWKEVPIVAGIDGRMVEGLIDCWWTPATRARLRWPGCSRVAGQRVAVIQTGGNADAGLLLQVFAGHTPTV